MHPNNTSTCTGSALPNSALIVQPSLTGADVGGSKTGLQPKWFAAENQQRLTRTLTHQISVVYSPCFLKILVIISCTCCCNLALLKLKLPWRETKQTASVRDQETSIKH